MSSETVSIVNNSELIKHRSVTRLLTARRISRGEILAVGLVALAIYTGLLLKLPYRTPLVNSLLTLCTFSSFYLYLKLRLALQMPLTMILCLVFAIVIDVIGNQFGLFSQRIASVPYDTITHFLASGFSLLPVMWLLMELIRRYQYKLPLGFIAFFSVTTAFSLAAYYEITELLDERLFGGHRMWTPRDTSQDLAADLAGIIIAAIGYTLVIRRRRRQSYL
jgi:uncharacterized membrane protein YjdF